MERNKLTWHHTWRTFEISYSSRLHRFQSESLYHPKAKLERRSPRGNPIGWRFCRLTVCLGMSLRNIAAPTVDA